MPAREAKAHLHKRGVIKEQREEPRAPRFVRQPLRAAHAALRAAYRTDDVAPLLALPLDVWSGGFVTAGLQLAILMFLNERGVPLPPPLLERMNRDAPQILYSALGLPSFVQIANALAEDDKVGLADAIDQAEGRGLGPHAARMRIVLAKRTGDHARLERAKPVLERLRDQQFLRRLKVVAATRG